jgi:hypothetical protein
MHGSITARIGRNLFGSNSYPSRAPTNSARWRLPRWTTRSSSVRPSQCSTRSTRKTSSASRKRPAASFTSASRPSIRRLTADDFATVDMRGLKAALVARAQAERVSVSMLMRGAAARDLGLSVEGERDQTVASTAVHFERGRRQAVDPHDFRGGCEVRCRRSSGGPVAGCLPGRPHRQGARAVGWWQPCRAHRHHGPFKCRTLDSQPEHPPAPGRCRSAGVTTGLKSTRPRARRVLPACPLSQDLHCIHISRGDPRFGGGSGIATALSASGRTENAPDLLAPSGCT